MIKYSLFLFIFLSVCLSAYAHKPAIDNYQLSFSRNADEPFNLHIECCFVANRDSLTLNFGGGNEFSVSGLTIVSDHLISYNYDTGNRILSMALKRNEKSTIKMSYTYTNLASAFLYQDYGSEFWEPSYREFFYPLVFGDKCDFSFTFDMPDSMTVVGGYGLEYIDGKYLYRTIAPVVSHSCTFALLDKNKYMESEFTKGGYSVQAFHKDGVVIPLYRISELAELTEASIAFFSNLLGPYEDHIDQIAAKPIYIFHGNGYSNRNNLNFISASLDKFISKPDIFPIVHEVGHRWLGEWTFMIEDGEPGAYFIKESLNEYMTLLFIKHYYGEDFFEDFIQDNYMRPYLSIKDTATDVPLIGMRYNTNNVVVYCKGPVLIHEIVKKWGEDNWTDFMRDFYMQYKHVPGLSYDMFISAMEERHQQRAKELDLLMQL